ncbi:hypothetical protein BCR42DRAFT_234156 [Absidia repens]|uniref:Uncharacterized protein n=1 Tax=Absidia repens TaxID=90262 RepID=A0A1X2IM65_9FUNG|nr:hypothetical protein BCR42DRAFT_234156 [Absidia repens]
MYIRHTVFHPDYFLLVFSLLYVLAYWLADAIAPFKRHGQLFQAKPRMLFLRLPSLMISFLSSVELPPPLLYFLFHFMTL